MIIMQENNNLDKQYKELLRHILKYGEIKEDRTGTGTISVFDYTIRHNMNDGFSLLTSKKMFMKGIIHELMWFLNGDTNIKYLIDNNVHIWDGDCYKNYEDQFLCENPPFGGPYTEKMLSIEEFIDKIKNDSDFAKQWGDLGPIYGKQWRDSGGYDDTYQSQKHMGGSFGGPTQVYYGETVKFHVNGVDQIKKLVYDLKNDPDSRRLIVNSWVPSDLNKMILPPCHYTFQCYTKKLTLKERKEIWTKNIDKSIHFAKEFGHSELNERNVPERKLSLKFTMRSTDVFLGLPFNLASYGLLLELLAKEVNMVSDELIFSGGDVHLYSNHISQAEEQLSRNTFKLPILKLKNEDVFNLKYKDIEILNYESSAILKGKLSN